jgi:hypothetical protein
MTTKQKIDLVIEYMANRHLWLEAVSEKNSAVKNQDFEEAVKLRAKELSISAKVDELGTKLVELMPALKNSDQNAQKPTTQ